MDTLWKVAIRVDELARAKEEGKMLVVIQAPDPVGPCWLKPVSCLDLPHQQEVALEHLVDRPAQVSLL